MTNEEAKKMLKAKLECLKRETSGTDIDCNYRNCDECNLCYEQGNMGEQKEALDIAIKALEQTELNSSYNSVKPELDCISREAVEKITWEEPSYTDALNVLTEVREKVRALPSVTPKTEWIPIKMRSMTEEEKEHFFEYADSRCDDTYTILDCPLPDDGQEVILSVNGYVSTDIFCRDSADGCYFESYDIDEVDAWMPFPQPYKEGEQ